MGDLNIDNNLSCQLLKLEKKYEAMGQDISGCEKELSEWGQKFKLIFKNPNE